MGHKVNPVLFRLGSFTPNTSCWHTSPELYSHFLLQDLELRAFLSNLLKNKGILLRSCIITRSSSKLLIDLDLYFSYILTRQAKFFWARSLFKTIKKKYVRINRIKDVKNLFQTLGADDSLLKRKNRRRYIPLSVVKRKKNFLSLFLKQGRKKIIFKNRLFFFLVLKKEKGNRLKKKDDIKLLSVVKNLNRTGFIRLSLRKFSRLFVLQKFKYNFRSYSLKKSVIDSCFLTKTDGFDLFELNKNLCRSIQSFCGIEEIELNLLSNQLTYLPSFKFIHRAVLKELDRFQKNRDLKKYFVETLENLYFVIRTFGFGNAYLLSCVLIFLLENMRKQVLIVRFIKKSLQTFFNRIPVEDIAVGGIKILIKGRFNKRRRTKKVVLQEGHISLQTISTPIDYYQTRAVTIYGSFGIKVWISKRII